MPDRESSGTVRGIVLGLICALLGALLGGGIGGFAFTPKNDLRKNPDPMAQGVADLLAPIDLCFAFVGMLIGGGVGGTLGGIAGVVLGFRSAARANRAAEASLDGPLPSESTGDEVARLQARVARLQDRIDDLHSDDRIRSEERPPGDS
jgi:hypothetical protein